MKKYVIQHRPRHWENRWEVYFGHEYDTLEEARKALAQIPVVKADLRIAEVYTVYRYKPVK